MPKRIAAATINVDSEGWSFDLSRKMRGVMRYAKRHPFDACALATAGALVAAIVVNALWLQKERHPTPLRTAEAPTIPAEPVSAVMPRPRPAPVASAPPQEASAPSAPAAPRAKRDILVDMQRELARRGFYDGPPDGIYGPKMDAAIRDFEAVAKLKPSQEPNEALLQAIMNSKVGLQSERSRNAGATGSIPRPPAPIATATSARVVAVQRALAEFGYGQTRPTGVLDETTKLAIEKFERERRLPITGQVSDRLVRELASVTGRPLE